MSGHGFHVHGPHDHAELKEWLMGGVYGASAIGIGLAVMGFMHM